jgi:signal transduction histidine kinase
VTNPSSDPHSKLAAEAEHAEATRDADLPYGIRLPQERITQLRQLAEARGVEPSVLARAWVIEYLDGEVGARGPDQTERLRLAHELYDSAKQHAFVAAMELAAARAGGTAAVEHLDAAATAISEVQRGLAGAG